MAREAAILWVGAQREAIALECCAARLLTNVRDGTGDDGTGVGTVEFRAVLMDERGWPEMTVAEHHDGVLPGVVVEVPGMAACASSGWPE